MSSVLIVGGDQVAGIKQVLTHYGVDHIHHWSDRKPGDRNKTIPNDTKIIVLITNWISHSITHKIKRHAMSRGIQVIYTPNDSQALQNRLHRLDAQFLVN
ncbi:MAG: DUF2325 domain-containing protein [Methylotenera sp.]|nr:DUF2325 domain-containing protein [Methylotenera sp.]